MESSVVEECGKCKASTFKSEILVLFCDGIAKETANYWTES